MDISWQRKLVSFLFSLLGIIKFNHRSLPNPIQKILVIQWDYLGDIIVSVPALQILRQTYPLADIVLLTSPENRSYIHTCPFVNRILYFKNPLHAGRESFNLKNLIKNIFQLRKEKFELIIELSGRLPNQFILPFLNARYLIGQDPTNNFYYLDYRVHSNRKCQIERNLDVIKAVGGKIEVDPYLLLWNPSTSKDREQINELFLKIPTGFHYVVIHPSASWKPRQWLMLNWVKVIDALLSKDCYVFFIGISTEYQLIEDIRNLLKNKNHINLAGDLTISQVISLMEKSNFFMGSDSGPMHLAAVAHLKGIVLFGPGDPIKWAYPWHNVVYKKVKCSPCAQLAFTKVCAQGLSTCQGLVDISAEEVIKESEKFVKS